MDCIRCESSRVLEVSGKVTDRCFLEDQNQKTMCGYTPQDIGIGGGDYIEFSYCLECGQIQDSFPVGDPEWDEDDLEWEE